jgi:predicted dehydrogenase
MHSQPINRRQFLGRTASCLAACGVSMVPASVLGRNGAVAPSNRIGLGFIGQGGRGRHIAPGFLRADVQAIATCDVWSDRAQNAKHRLKAEHAYTDFRELLACEDIDAVVIATPEHWHVPIGVAAAAAGKDMYCEKSLGTTIAEGRSLCRAIERYGRVFQFGTQQRSERNFRFACELVRNGRIGQLQTITVSVPGGGIDKLFPPASPPKELDFDMWLGPAPEIPYVGQALDDRWAGMPDYAPGFLSTWGVHHSDIAQWGHGTGLRGPVEIQGQGEYSTREYCHIAEKWRAECLFADGVRLVHVDNSKAPQGVKFQGTEGSVYVRRGNVLQTTPDTLKTSAILPHETRLYESRDHAGNFLDCVKSRRRTVSPVEIAHRSTSISLLCDIAMRLGRKVKWDPDGETFPGDEEANRMLSRTMRAPWQV